MTDFARNLDIVVGVEVESPEQPRCSCSTDNENDLTAHDHHMLTCEDCGQQAGALWNGSCLGCIVRDWYIV